MALTSLLRGSAGSSVVRITSISPFPRRSPDHALVRADRELAEDIRRVRLDNAEAILEAKNERTASLYLDGLLDTEDHRRLEVDRARADLDLQHARREVERLHLIVRLLGTQSSEKIKG